MEERVVEKDFVKNKEKTRTVNVFGSKFDRTLTEQLHNTGQLIEFVLARQKWVAGAQLGQNTAQRPDVDRHSCDREGQVNCQKELFRLEGSAYHIWLPG